MFKSQLTGKQYGPGVKPVRVVVETRPKTYRNEYRNYEGRVTVKFSEGTEIVRELVVGPDEIK